MIRVGDFIVGKGILWEITSIYKSGVDTLYNIKCLNQPAEFLETYNWAQEKYEKAEVDQELSGVTHGYLRHLGQLVPKEESQKAIEILFKSN